jgi:hypothetical protein
MRLLRSLLVATLTAAAGGATAQVTLLGRQVAGHALSRWHHLLR